MKQIPFFRPDISDAEIEEVAETLRSGWITTGPKTRRLEKELARYCGVKRMVCLNSATAALECALRILGIGPGDEVITSPYTYTASASPIVHVGATPVLVDLAADSLEMDYDRLESAITERTKAVIPVDVGGIMCDYDRIFSTVEAASGRFHPANELQEALGRVAVVADGAHSLGATYHGRPSGSIADFTSFSFHAVKNLTTAEGGAITWRDTDEIPSEDVYRRAQLLSLHGQTESALEKTKLGSWTYDIAELGYKWNMTDVQASLGLAQLQRYPSMLARRKEILERYRSGLETDENVKVVLHYTDEGSSSGHLAIVRMLDVSEKKRDEVMAAMAARGVACNVHYRPLPMMTAYHKMGMSIMDHPCAYDFYKGEITLPLYTMLSDEDIERIIADFHSARRECLG